VSAASPVGASLMSFCSLLISASVASISLSNVDSLVFTSSMPETVASASFLASDACLYKSSILL
jgi:hypothetical protein